MVDITNSKDPKDIATFVYFFGYPLVTMQRSFDYFINPNIVAKEGVFSGQANSFSYSKELVNSSDRDINSKCGYSVWSSLA